MGAVNPVGAGDSCVDPDAVPGVERLQQLLDLSVAELTVSQRLDLMAELEQHAAWLDAIRLYVLAEAAGPDPLTVSAPAVATPLTLPASPTPPTGADSPATPAQPTQPTNPDPLTTAQPAAPDSLAASGTAAPNPSDVAQPPGADSPANSATPTQPSPPTPPTQPTAPAPVTETRPFWDQPAVSDDIVDEISVVLTVTRMSAQRRVELARQLNTRFRQTWHYLLRGRVTYYKALIMVEECELLSQADIDHVATELLPLAQTMTPNRFRQAIRRLVMKLQPPAPKKLATELAKRDVQLFTDGVLSTIVATLPTPDAILLFNTINDMAHRQEIISGTVVGPGRVNSASPNAATSRSTDPIPPNPDRDEYWTTMANRRADALSALAHLYADAVPGPLTQGKWRGEAQIVIDLPTLLGLQDNPGYIKNVGPIPAAAARQFAAQTGRWRRLVTEPVSGHLLDFGTATYRPPAELREFVLSRDATCQFPGCEISADRCDIDHVEPFPNASRSSTGTGSTSADNLVALCRRHHRMKTHNGWQLTISHEVQATTITWTSPNQRVYHRCRRNHEQF